MIYLAAFDSDENGSAYILRTGGIRRGRGGGTGL